MQLNRILTRALTIIALFFFFFQFIQAQLLPLDTRCLWIVRQSMYSKEKIDSAFVHAYQAGYDDVFIQVRGRGYAFYDANIVPKHPKIESGFNPLAYSIK